MRERGRKGGKEVRGERERGRELGGWNRQTE